jgi:hypothetical protein
MSRSLAREPASPAAESHIGACASGATVHTPR